MTKNFFLKIRSKIKSEGILSMTKISTKITKMKQKNVMLVSILL